MRDGLAREGRAIDAGGVPVHLAEPQGAARGAVVVVQEAFGVTGHLRAVAGRLAARGWVAAAPALYHRTGAPELGYEAGPDDLAPHLGALTTDQVLSDVDATVALLGRRGFAPDRVGLVGFCLGGWVSFLVATRRELGASVGFYGTIVTSGLPSLPSLVGEAAGLRTPWQGHFGAEDRYIPVADVARLVEALAPSPVPHEVHTYEGAGHGFACDERPSYAAGASELAWDRALAWLDRYLGATEAGTGPAAPGK